MGNVGGEVAGPGALLGIQLPLTGQDLLGIADGILQSGKAVFFQCHIQHGAVPGEIIFDYYCHLFDPSVPMPVLDQEKQAEHGKYDQSTH